MDTLTTRQAAEKLGYTPEHVRYLVCKGVLRPIRERSPPRPLRFAVADLDQYRRPKLGRPKRGSKG